MYLSRDCIGNLGRSAYYCQRRVRVPRLRAVLNLNCTVVFGADRTQLHNQGLTYSAVPYTFVTRLHVSHMFVIHLNPTNIANPDIWTSASFVAVAPLISQVRCSFVSTTYTSNCHRHEQSAGQQYLQFLYKFTR